MTAHEIDYRIYGEEMQFVEIELDPKEGVVAEAGSFMMMDDGIKMETIFGDGSKKDTGFLGKILGAGKRILTGESLFMTAFYNNLSGKKNVSFASPYPGKIIPIELYLSKDKGFEYGTYICLVKEEFITEEIPTFCWADLSYLPKNVHTGLRSTLNNSLIRTKIETVLELEDAVNI